MERFKLIVRDSAGKMESVGSFATYAEALDEGMQFWSGFSWHIQGPPAKPLQDQLQHKIDQLYIR